MKKKKSAYDSVCLARDKNRPGIYDYIDNLFTDFIELRGDRVYGDDKSMIGGIALFHKKPVTIIGHRKGRNTEENIEYNFGMASPWGYRKGIRLMEQAERFGRPVITFIDTPGAYPGLEAEANGQAVAIAESIACMSRLKVPTIAIITGEGCSGGALAIATADRVCCLENSIYTILSPEGFAAILWKDAKRADEASELMGLTASELHAHGIIDDVIKEGDGLYDRLDRYIRKELSVLCRYKPDRLIEKRYEKYKAMTTAERTIE